MEASYHPRGRQEAMDRAVEQRITDVGPPGLSSEWELRVASGGGAGRVLVVPAGGGTLGADPACTLPLAGEGVAGLHLRILRREDGGLGWEAAAPSTRVIVDGRPAGAGPLVDGSRLQLGALVLTVARRTALGLPSLPSAPPEPPDQLLAPGTVLADRYRIESVIGQGGMGTVYLAQHLSLGKSFAVKVLKAVHTARPDFVARFQREAVAASQIHHPGIVNVVDFGRTPEGGFYCAMEHLPGETLAERLAARGAFPVSEAVRVARDMAKALAAAHARGIFHRDIKPENVLLVPEPEGPEAVKLVDFGIARLADTPRDGRETGDGLILGTPQYMSPEQASGLSQDARADVYSLGVLLWELLAGRPPFRGASATHVLAAHLLEPAPRLPDRGPPGPIPRRLSALVARMMAKLPEGRPGRMEDVVAELDASLLPGPSRAGGWVALLAALAVTSGLGAVWVARHRPAPTPAAVAPPSLPEPAPVSRSDAPELAPASEAPVAVPSPSERPVEVGIVSEPAGAKLTVDGRASGRTPLRLTLAEGKRTRLRLTLPGYAPVVRLVRPSAGLAITVRLTAEARPGLLDLKDSPY
jgi:eukaryotic-like serine/threonine-protein kinase